MMRLEHGLMAIANNFGLPILNITELNTHCIPQELLHNAIIQKHAFLPFYQCDDKLFIAIADPANQLALDEVRFCTGLRIYPVLVEVDKLTQVIKKLQSSPTMPTLSDLGENELTLLETGREEIEKENISIAVDADDAPMIRLVQKILLDAIKKGASDIHFESYENNFRVRMRTDGILHETASPPIALATRIAARIKVMARLDISERRIPQDGRFKMKLSEHRTIDFRVSTCPTIAGEKIVIRLLDPSAATMEIDALGFEPQQKTLFSRYLNQPQGMILVTGPTGSGKTITLYAALNFLNSLEHNISTVEDPVEIYVNGINQVNINPKAGLTFATVLRAFLRQDPDIIMVGEMRDLETAEIAVKAAQTGHLVLSTLHTNSTIETLSRLQNIGLPTYNVATSVSLIIAQRLARKLCNYCRVETNIPQEILIKEGFAEEIFGSFKIFSSNIRGCDHCHNGYQGRTGIFEMLPISENISYAILNGIHHLELSKLARQEGMQGLRQSGLLKVQQGITSLEEINRITKD